jgi:adenosine deaminase
LGKGVARFAKYFKDARDAGFGITLHIAEVTNHRQNFRSWKPHFVDFFFFQIDGSGEEEALDLIGFKPDRLGHATFLQENAKAILASRTDDICVELCLTSNLLYVLPSRVNLTETNGSFIEARPYPLSKTTTSDITLRIITTLLSACVYPRQQKSSNRSPSETFDSA